MATVISGGNQIIVKNLSVPQGSDTQIGFAQAVNTVIIKCRTASDLQIRSSSGASEYFTLPSGDTLTLYLTAMGQEDGAMLPTNIWLRSPSGTINAEIIGIYGN